MLGAKTIEIDGKDFVLGMSTSNSLQDGGFSVGTSPSGSAATVVNPLVAPGLINFPASSTDKSTNLVGEMIASSEDPTGTYARLLVSTHTGGGDTQAGRYWTIDSTGTLTQRGSADVTNTYIYGRSDMIAFQGEAYVTTNSTIERWQLPATFNAGADFPFSFSDAFAPHPALTFEDNAFYGDGNLLLRQTTAGVAPTTILTLPANQVIVSLGIDPGSGRMLISVVDQYNVSGIVNSQARVLYYDGFSNKAVKVVLVDDMITAFYNVGGTVFITYGQRLGYWTGSGIEFLRTLLIALDNTQLAYKHHLTNIGEILYIVETKRILAYGQIIKGKPRAFWYAFDNTGNSTPTLTLVTNIGQNQLAYSYATAKWLTLDVTSVASLGTGALYSHEYRLPRIVTFAQVIIEYDAAITANTNIGTLSLLTDSPNDITLATVNVGDETLKKFFIAPYQSVETRILQIRYLPTQVLAIKRITIFFDPKD